MEEAKFVGIDSWGRPVFKDRFKNYYCLVDILFSRDDIPSQEEIDGHEVIFKGRSKEAEPHWPVKDVRLVV